MWCLHTAAAYVPWNATLILLFQIKTLNFWRSSDCHFVCMIQDMLICNDKLVTVPGRRVADLLYIQYPPSQAHVLPRVWCAEFLHTSVQPWWQGSHYILPGSRHCAVYNHYHLWWKKLGGIYGGWPYNQRPFQDMTHNIFVCILYTHYYVMLVVLFIGG